MTEAQRERARVVAWLLDEVKTIRSWSQIQAVRHYAHRIERGDHLKGVE